MDYSICRAAKDDIPGVSKVHMECFEGYFLHAFGEEFLNIYYENYLACDKHVLLAAKSKGQIIGFVAGTLNKNILHQTLFKKSFSNILYIGLKRLFISRSFRNQLIRKKQFLSEGLKAKFHSSRPLHGEENASWKKNDMRGNLLSIAVVRDFQGKGVAVDLVREFEREIKRKGVTVCTLSVKSTNERGIRFYKKTDWNVFRERKDSLSFEKQLTGISCEEEID